MISCFQVPPWDGTVFLPLLGLRNVINTCPIDNFLVITHAFWKTDNLFNQELTQSLDPYASTMIKVFRLFDQGKFGDGKFRWLQQFTGRFDFANQVTVDVWGNEDDLFVSRLEASLHTTFQSHCCSQNCPRSTLDMHTKRIALR